MYGVGGRVAGLLRPLRPLEQLLDRARPRHRVDQRRQVAQRHVLVPVERRQVDQRRRPAEQVQRHEPAERGAQPRDLDDRAAGNVRHAEPDVRLDGEELRPVDAAERLARVRDPRRVEVAGAVAVDVHPDLDLAHELHQVDDGLSEAVAVRDQRVRREGVDALGRVDRRIRVLVDAAAAGGKDDGRAGGAVDDQRPERAAAVADDVDRDRGDPTPCQRRGDQERARVLVVAEAVPEDRDRPAAGRRCPGGQEEVEVEAVRPLDGCADDRPRRRNHPRRVLVVGRVEGAERDRPDAAGIERRGTAFPSARPGTPARCWSAARRGSS